MEERLSAAELASCHPGVTSELRVAIDCRSLQDRPVGGVGRSVAGILPSLASAAEVDALLDARLPEPLGLPDRVRRHPLIGPLSRRGFAWLQVSVPRWLRGYQGIFHCPFYGLPYWQPVPMVVTIHDLTFEFAGHWYDVEQRMAFRRQGRWAARTARRILVHSEHVRSTVLEAYGRYGVSPERILVVGFPVDSCFSPTPPGAEDALRRFALTPPYVVTLGGARRRQLGVAVDAWERARKQLGRSPRELRLVVVGSERPPARDGVSYLGVLADPDWAAVLAGACAFCSATLYEGYGMPALEAAASGTPVVCARVGSLPELLGDGAAWSDAPEAPQLADALVRVLEDERLAAAVTAAGLERVRALPGWSQTAAVTLRAYREALA